MKRTTKKIAREKKAEVGLGVTMQQWHEGVDTSKESTTIPRVYLAQGKFKGIAEGICKEGQFVSLVTNQVISDQNNEMEMVFFYKTLGCIEYQQDAIKNTLDFIRTFPMDTNPSSPNYVGSLELRSGIEGHPTLIRVIRKCMYYFGFLRSAEGYWDTSIPYIFGFTGAGYSKGCDLSTEIYSRNKQLNLAPCAYSVVLSSEERVTAGHTYLVPTFRRGEDVPMHVQDKAYEWLQSVRVDKKELVETSIANSNQSIYERTPAPAHPQPQAHVPTPRPMSSTPPMGQTASHIGQTSQGTPPVNTYAKKTNYPDTAAPKPQPQPVLNHAINPQSATEPVYAENIDATSIDDTVEGLI